jgi:hypothetical protein
MSRAAGPSAPALVQRYDAVVVGEVGKLGIPRPGTGAPTVDENHRGACADVLVVDLSVVDVDKRHTPIRGRARRANNGQSTRRLITDSDQ